MFAQNGGFLTAHTCTSFGTVSAGFEAQGVDSVMELSCCTSHRDSIGCVVFSGSKLTAREVVVSESGRDGFELQDVPEEAVLKECAATRCGGHGVCAYAAAVDAEGCSFQQNKGCGVLANFVAVVVMRGCRSSQNEAEGYCAKKGVHLKVINSFIDGDKEGCRVSKGGQSED